MRSLSGYEVAAPPPPPGLRERPDEPSFSVVIAAYQSARAVGAAIESALDQTLAPAQVVVCDDGSTDDTAAAVAPYRDRIRFLRCEHGGEAAAKNAAVRATTGEFVVILDADDLFLPDRLRAIAELARRRPDLDIITTDAYLEVGGRVVRRCYTPEWRFEVGDQRRAILRRNFVFGLAAVRREALLAIGGFDEELRWATDWDCWLRLVFAGSIAGAVLAPLARYRLSSGNLTSRRAELVQARLQVLRKAERSLQLARDERAVLAESIARQDRELAVLLAGEAVRAGASDARRRCLEIARDRRMSRRNRIKAALAATAPPLARAIAHRRDERSWVGASGARFRRA